MVKRKLKMKESKRVRSSILNSIKGENGYFRLFVGQDSIITIIGRLKMLDKDFLLIESEKGRDVIRVDDLHSVNMPKRKYVKEFEKEADTGLSYVR